MASDDPWRDIAAAHSSQINARRVTQATPWGLYWAVDADRNVLLILQHRGTIRRSRRLPKLRGLRVEAQPADGGSDERIVIRLTDSRAEGHLSPVLSRHRRRYGAGPDRRAGRGAVPGAHLAVAQAPPGRPRQATR